MSFTDLYGRNDRYVSGVVRSLIGTRDAEDICQEVWVTVQRNLTRFDGRNERGWLRAIAVGHVRNYRRLCRREVPAGTLPGRPVSERHAAPLEGRYHEPTTTTFIGPEEAAIAQDQLNYCLRVLAVADRRAILAVDVQGLSYRQAAAQLGISMTALSTRLLKGRWALKLCLEEKGK